MKYYENDEFVVPQKYQKMTAEQLGKKCGIVEKWHTLVSKLKPSVKENKLDSLGFKVNL
ncbi:MAG: hypothetical protein IJF60_05075 [Agathobacter sp.]|nr:hypothetical protein [Agathobacter sp.]